MRYVGQALSMFRGRPARLVDKMADSTSREDDVSEKLRNALSWCFQAELPASAPKDDEPEMVCAALAWCLQNDLSLLAHKNLNWESLRTQLEQDRKQLLKKSSWLKNFPTLQSLIDDPDTTIHPWTASLLQSLGEACHLFLRAQRGSTRHLLKDECISLFKTITLLLKNSREYNILRYNHSLTRKYTNAGRHIHISKWKVPKSTNKKYMVVHSGSSMVLLCSRRRKCKAIDVPSFRNGRISEYTLVSRSARSHTITYIPRWKQQPLALSSFVPLNTRLTSKFRNALSTTQLQTTPLQAFKLFPLLPPELRLKIYKLARPPPQIIRIHKKTDFTLSVPQRTPYAESELNYNPSIYSTNTYSPLVHTSRETREYAIQNWYPSCLPTDYQDGLTFFCDPAYDYFYPGCSSCKDVRCPECDSLMMWSFRNKCERLIVHGSSDGYRRYMSPLVSLTFWFIHAREVLVLHPNVPALKVGTIVQDLKAVEHKFEWQNDGETLMDIHKREAAERNAKLVERHEAEVKRYEKQKLQIKQILNGEKSVEDGDVEEGVKSTLEYIEEVNRSRAMFKLKGLNWGTTDEYFISCLLAPSAIEKDYVKALERCDVVELDAGSKNVGEVYGFLEEVFRGGAFVF